MLSPRFQDHKGSLKIRGQYSKKFVKSRALCLPNLCTGVFITNLGRCDYCMGVNVGRETSDFCGNC